jgi:hypothetical protein
VGNDCRRVTLRAELCLNFLRAQASAHRFKTKKVVLPNHELAHAAFAQQILTATLDPKQEDAEKGSEERQGEARRSKERR